MDALGSDKVVAQAMLALRLRRRHLQVGLLPSAVRLDMSPDRAGAAAAGKSRNGRHAYPEMLELVASGALKPAVLITRTVSLDDVPEVLATLTAGTPAGVTVINP